MTVDDDPLGPEVRADLEKRISGLESERSELFTQLAIAVGVAVAVVLVLILSMRMFGWSNNGLWLITIFGIMGAGFYAYLRVHGLRQRGKNDLMTRISAAMGFDYSLHGNSFPIAPFSKLGLLPKHDRRKLYDNLSGTTAGGKQLDVVDARLQVAKHSSGGGKNGRSKTTYVTIFQGLLLRIGSEMDFSGQVLVLRDAGLIGNAIKGWRQTNETVFLESERFNSTFTVYADDQVTARRLLTPKIMERCLDLAERTHGTPQIAFTQGQVLIALHRNRESFELPQIWQQWDAKAFENMLDDLRYTLQAATFMGREIGRERLTA